MHIHTHKQTSNVMSHMPIQFKRRTTEMRMSIAANQKVIVIAPIHSGHVSMEGLI